jgi:hypothetical protein
MRRLGDVNEKRLVIYLGKSSGRIQATPCVSALKRVKSGARCLLAHRRVCTW